MTSRFGRLALATTLALAGLCPTARAGNPAKPPPDPVDPGTVYFYNGSQLWSMKPDGTSKNSVLPPQALPAAPSRALHSGKRWFLFYQVVNPNVFYPLPEPVAGGCTYDSRPQEELFALSDQGDLVQLTDDPLLEHKHFFYASWSDPEPRWAKRDGVADGRVSFLARHWALGADGKWFVDGIGLYHVDLDPDQLASGVVVAQVPQRLETVVLPVEFAVRVAGRCDKLTYGWTPAVCGYDWSPDGSRVVFDTWSGGLFITEIAAGATSQVCGDGSCPRWSPVQPGGGSQILFVSGIAYSTPNASRRIDRINPNGSGRVMVVPATSTKQWLGYEGGYHWSPQGTHFVYSVITSGSGQLVSGAVYRAAADGTGRVNLTSKLNNAYPAGWVDP